MNMNSHLMNINPIQSSTTAARGPACQRRTARKGAMLVLVAVTVIILLIAVAFSVDVAFMQLTRTQLRTSTDAAARAATEALSREQSVTSAIAAARNAASLNPVAGTPLQLADTDIVFGHADAQNTGEFDFQQGTSPFNSVLVTGRRTDDSPNGSVGLMFGGILGRQTFVPRQTARTVNLDRDICLVIDRSGSMNWLVSSNNNPSNWNRCNGPHPSLSRWAGLDRAMTLFLGILNQTDLDEFVGLASYSSAHTSSCGVRFAEASIEARLSNDYSQIEAAMDRYNSSGVSGWTNIAAGIDEGVDILTDPTRTRIFAEKTLVVLTDGQENRPVGVVNLGTSAPASPRGAVRAAMEAKVIEPDMVIHTITFSDAANETTMQEVARVGGGSHFHAPTTARLEEIFREIAYMLPVVMAE